MNKNFTNKVVAKINDRCTEFDTFENKIKQMDIKMVDMCDTLEGMVNIIKDNGNQIKQQLEDKINSVTEDLEIFETKINRSNSDIVVKIQSLADNNQRMIEAIKTLHAQQVYKLNGLIEEADEDVEEEGDVDSDTDQENLVPNKDVTAKFKSTALKKLVQTSEAKQPNPYKANSAFTGDIKIVD